MNEEIMKMIEEGVIYFFQLKVWLVFLAIVLVILPILLYWGLRRLEGSIKRYDSCLLSDIIVLKKRREPLARKEKDKLILICEANVRTRRKDKNNKERVKSINEYLMSRKIVRQRVEISVDEEFYKKAEVGKGIDLSERIFPVRILEKVEKRAVVDDDNRLE